MKYITLNQTRWIRDEFRKIARTPAEFGEIYHMFQSDFAVGAISELDEKQYKKVPKWLEGARNWMATRIMGELLNKWQKQLERLGK